MSVAMLADRRRARRRADGRLAESMRVVPHGSVTSQFLSVQASVDSWCVVSDQDSVLWLAGGARVDAHLLPCGGRGSGPIPSAPGTEGCGRGAVVTVVVAAHDEESVIERRVENLLALDYPPEHARSRRCLRCVHRPHEQDRLPNSIARAASPTTGVRRGGKVDAQNRAVHETESEIMAFSDANATWASDAFRRLVATSPIPRSLTSAGSSGFRPPTERTRRAPIGGMRCGSATAESRLGSMTGGNGSIYALKRADYVRSTHGADTTWRSRT